MSVIFQDFAKYQLTARENIRVGNVDSAAGRPRESRRPRAPPAPTR